jgi:hypothetical protein
MFTLPPPPPFCLVPCVPALGDECSQLDESVIVEEFVSHPSLESLCKRSPADREGVLRKKISYRSARKDELKKERRVTEKKLDLLMKSLRSITFSELPDGAFEFISVDDCDVEDVDVHDFSNVKKLEMESRKELHNLVQKANKVNKLAKKKRKSDRKVITEANECIYDPTTDFKSAIYNDCPIFLAKDVDALEMISLEKCGYVFSEISACYFSKSYVESIGRKKDFFDPVNEVKEGHYRANTDFIEALKDERIYTFDYPERFGPEEEKMLLESGFFKTDISWTHAGRRRNLVESMFEESAVLRPEGFSFSSYMEYFGDLISKIPGFDKYGDLADDLINTLGLLYLLYRESSVSRRIMIFHLYLGSLGVYFSKKVASTALYAIVDNIISSFTSTSKPIIETESLSDHLSHLSFMVKSVAGSSLVSSIRNLVVSVAALKFLEKDVAMEIFKYFGNAPTCSILDLVTLLIDSLAALFRVGEGLIKGLPLSELLFTTDPVTAAVIEGKRLIAMKDMLYAGLPVEGKMCQKDFVNRGLKVMPILDMAVKHSNPLKSGYKAVSEVFSVLGPLISEVKLRIFGCDRVPPFCIVLHGDPGIGKSTLMNWLYRVHSNVMKRKFTTSQIFSRINTSDFWEGYDPCSHPYIHYSELGNIALSMAKTKGDPILSELTSVIDSVAMPLNMAFTGKGKVYFIGELVIIDTNNPKMNMDVLFANPAAFRRRFLYINPSVLPDLRKLNSTGIDINKGKDRRLCDKYSFDVYREIEMGVSESRRDFMMQNGDIDTLYDMLTDFFTQGISNETGHLSNKTNDVNISYGVKYKDNSLYTDPSLVVPVVKDDVVVLAPSVYDTQADEEFFSEDKPKVNFNNFGFEEVRYFLESYFNKDGTSNSFSQLYRYVLQSFLSTVLYFGDLTVRFCTIVNYTFVCSMFLINPLWAMLYVAAASFCEYCGVTVIGDFIMSICYADVRYRVKLAYYFLKNCSGLVTDSVVSTFDCAVIETVSFFNPKMGQLVVAPYMRCFQFVLLFMYLYFVEITPMSLFVILTGLYMCTLLIPVFGDEIQAKKISSAKGRRNYHLLKLRNFFTDDMSMLFVAPQHFEVYAFYAMIAMGVFYAAKKLFFGKKKDFFTEDLTEFKIPDVSNSDLNDHEEKLCCKQSLLRTKGKSPDVWCVQSIRNDFVHTGDAMSLSNAVKSNVRLLRVNDATWTTSLGICEDFLILNTHALPKLEEFKVSISMTGDRSESGQFKHCIISPKFRCDLGNDITILRICQLQFKDIRKHFSDNVFTRTTGVIAGQKTIVKMVSSITANNPTYGSITVENAVRYEMSNHQKGDCGSPLLVDFAGKAFVASIHFAGRKETTEAFGAPIILTKILDGLEKLKSDTVLMPIVSQSDTVVTLEVPRAKSVFMYENLHNLDLIGYDGEPLLVNNKSRLRKSILHVELPELFFDSFGFIPSVEYAPPMMRPGYVNGEYVSPFNTNLKKINTEKKSLNREFLEDCIEHFVDRIVVALRKKGVHGLSPLTFDEAVNGANVDAYLRRVNASTGSGYGFKGKKDKHIPVVFEDHEVVTREPTADLKAKLRDKLEDFRNDRSKGTVFGAKLKDEPRDVLKVAKGKTRMFYPAPIDSLILARQVLAPIFTRMVEFNDIFMTSVGINMHMDGEKLFKTMSDFADSDDCIFDGDYGGFDTSMPYEIGLAASSVLYRVAEKMGYTVDALLQMKGVLSDNLFPIIEVIGDTFIAAGLMTSGSYGTAEFNCIRNVLMMMYYFRSHPTLTLNDFYDGFFKTTYGDDVTGVVKKCIQDKFNNVLYAKFCKDIFGMDFTTPSKTESVVPLRKLEDFSFLKRNFAMHPQFGDVKAVLEMDSIYKMLYWVLPSNNVTSLDQLMATCSAALWELFLRLSRKDFEIFRNSLIKLIESKIEIKVDTQDLPTWERICCTLQPTAMELREEEVHDHSLLINNMAPIVIDDADEGKLQW